MKWYLMLILTILTMSSCSQELGPGYKFELFDNTPCKQLAEAVKNEDTEQINQILKYKKADINFQEPKYHNTLLSLAVSNGKLQSVKLLLKYNADLNLINSDGFAPIHDATNFISLRKNVSEILELLLQHGANPNMIANSSIAFGTSNKYVPLMGAVENLKCTKMLLKYGANLYFKVGNNYPVWTAMFVLDKPESEHIFVSHYLIVQKHLDIPDPIFFTIPNNKPKGVFDLLSNLDVSYDAKKAKAKAEIISYLKKNNFPKSGAYTK